MAMQDFNFYNTQTPDYLKKSFVGNLIRIAPNGTAPLFCLTSMMGDGVSISVEHGYFSKSAVFPKVQVDGVLVAGDTTFVVDSTSEIIPGDLLMAPSREIVRVVSVTDATTFVVARAFGQVAAGGIADDAQLYLVGNSFEQGSKRPQSRLINPVRVINFTQIIRNNWQLPHTLTAVEPVAGGPLTAESRQDCAFFHAQAIELALIFGQKSSGFVNGQYVTTMDGLIEHIRRYAPSGNTTTAGATTTYIQLETALEPVFNTITNGRNGNQRTLFVGATARTVINNIGRLSGQYQIVDGQTTFGLQFSTFKTTRGVFQMVEHPIFNSNPTWARMALAVDLPSLKICYLRGRKTMSKSYGEDKQPVEEGLDAVGGDLLTELTLEVQNPAAHAVIYGLTAAA